MNVRVIVHLEVPSKKQLKVVTQALKPEIEKSSSTRSKVLLYTDQEKLVLDLRAKDTSAMRAAVNSYLRLIGVAMNLQKLTE